MNKDRIENILIASIVVAVMLAIIAMVVAIALDEGGIAIGAMLTVVVVTLIYSLIMSVLD